MSSEQLGILTAHLADLLGFEDGASDVLEHLLSIESRADLLDYLVQLLGSDRHDRLVDFVDNVERFQQGDVVVSLEEQAAQAPPLATVATKKPALVTLTSKKAPPPPQPASRLPNKSVTPVASAPPPPTTKAQATTKPSPFITAAAASASTTRPSNRNKKKAAELQEQNQKPKRPLQGKASSMKCGCFGSLHKALTNCLHCGRISCEREGYDYCPFCGYLVEEVVRDTATTIGDEAWMHKERLLKYDRETAQRTVVVDDQADYYSNTKSVWLNDDERQEAARQDRQRQDELHLRKKMQLSLSLS